MTKRKKKKKNKNKKKKKKKKKKNLFIQECNLGNKKLMVQNPWKGVITRSADLLKKNFLWKYAQGKQEELWNYMTTRIHAQIISKVTVDRQLAFHGSICNVYSEKKTSHNPRELNVLEKKLLIHCIMKIF